MSAPSLSPAVPRISRARLRFSLDLLLVLALACTAPALTFAPTLLRVPLGIALVLFAPGYAMQALLFPRREFDPIARAALSFGLSIALVPLLALLLDALPGGLRPEPIVYTTALCSGLLSATALLRRLLAPTVDGRRSASGAHEKPRTANRRPLALAVLTLVAALGVAALFVPAAPPPTEFYALGATGLAEDYPRAVAPGAPVEVQLGVTNHERGAMRYRIEARLGTTSLARSAPIEIGAGASWRGPLRFSLPQAGDDQMVDLMLLASDDPRPVRQLRLVLNVREMP